MAKNRNKKKRSGLVSMDTSESAVNNAPEAMEISEPGALKPSTGDLNRSCKVKKGRQMKRSKNVRKMKAVAKAIAKTEQSVVKVSKSEDKASRSRSAKLLYD